MNRSVHQNAKGELLAAVGELCRSRDICVIGIDGLGGAGKSTIAEELCRGLSEGGSSTVLLHIDDFINKREVRYDPAYPEWQCYYELQWQYGYFRSVIEGLLSGKPVDAELYDKENDSYFTQSFSAAGRCVIIVEGVFLQREELRGLFDLTVYIDVPEAVRLERVLRRDTYIGGEDSIRAKYENRYFPAERKYVSEYRPKQSADLVIE